jgi:hypothetical protein
MMRRPIELIPSSTSRITTRFAAVAFLTVVAASVLAAGCSTSKPAETTVAADSSRSVPSPDSAGTTATPADTTSATETSATADADATEPTPAIAVGEPDPSATTQADPSQADPELATDSAPTSDTTAGAAPAAGPAELTEEQLTSAFNAMGIPVVADKLSCVKEKAGKTDMSAPEPPPEFLRALMSCVPKSLVIANGQKLSASATKSGVTAEKASCFQEKTFETMAATDIAAFTKLLDANAPVDFPAEIKATIKENTKICALTDAQFSSLLEG